MIAIVDFKFPFGCHEKAVVGSILRGTFVIHIFTRLGHVHLKGRPGLKVGQRAEMMKSTRQRVSCNERIEGLTSSEGLGLVV